MQKNNKKILRELDWLKKETEKDQSEIMNHKRRMIDEIKQLDKKEMFKVPEKKKTSIFKKVLMIFGYGKKG